ncbi:MAG: glycosyltransferase family 4 protein [Methanomicrobiaceae archaeon]|uniref:Glycosyltransferase n=1 Tax=hydrocarbon metagenome TaxID=938273 RepID=A0A0W8FI27_9ZZZZ|nr:glycosyltransferase family 4 protein [Methanomicrobiaceae archaeon]MDD5420444.1 glycosyltransferase family 4 protein [Methanomicrobiaceae archaeon]
MERNTRVFFVCPSLSSFIRGDLELLKRHYDVRALAIDDARGEKNGNDRFALLQEIIKGVLWSDVTYAWFAHNHALAAVWLSKLLRKKSIVVIGGYEVAREPEIDYGARLDPELARKVKYILENADSILAVSHFNAREISGMATPRHLETIYNGIDCALFTPDGMKEDVVLTVARINRQNIRRKGLDTFISTARYFPGVRFVIVGNALDDSIEELRRVAPKNVAFTGSIPHEELIGWYRRARVYCQLSYYESFGVALVEAMSCECVPVVADRGAMPEVVGETGFLVPYGDPLATAEVIYRALLSGNGKDARKRVKQKFSIQEREKKIIEAIRGNAV